ncbi:universal stress protein [Janibacter cremeus]|uniref:Nucleotide-binding universal stress UspA family protein n=1 Tax=Janibacter cremeus TaxID=1285192 RepID=A0A852VRL5_9MICO|nr:universal stress protein [Janibacter cremeus]NYF98498.1 nucleotide-binding universal stress UspA family protein [Janibacter cremeus]
MASKPIIVGIDGSADSVRALKWAAEHARLVDAPLVGLVAWDLEPVYGYMAMTNWETSESVEREARTMMADAIGDALGKDAQIEERSVRGHAAKVLVEASEDAQLVVVGSRGRGGFMGMLLGSVSQHVVTHARCPVMVMPHEDQPKK